ncbi:MAG: M1 family metallopeptidase, partial [Myxococcales bacterium]|nr:M1 family metallopeptidase [Myxococcales bacterium]
DARPERYRLALDIDPAKETFHGHAEIDIEMLRRTSILVLHGRDLSVTKALFRTKAGDVEAKASSRAAFGARDGLDELVLTFATDIGSGKGTLVFEYDAPFGNLNGIYRVEADGKWFAFTQMEPNDARRAFPSFDEPRFRAPIELTLNVPKGMTAYANTRQTKREDKDATTRFSFAPTEPIPTYLFAIAVGDLEEKPGKKLPGSVIAEQGAPSAIRLLAVKGRAGLGDQGLVAAEKTLTALSTYFNRPYPYDKLDVAAVPNFGPGAMENAGLVTFREELLLVTEASSAQARRRMQLVMAHELAHQWFGNLVTMKWWDDLWLNEGFASWMQTKTCDAAFPGFSGREDRVLDRNYAMNADVLPSARAVRPKVKLADQIREAGGWSAYQKGSSILAMLEAWAGESTFQEGIVKYVNDNAGKSITSRELFVALDAATKKPMSKVASTFLDQPGLPLIDVNVTCDASSTSKITISQSPAGGSEKARWEVPVCLRIDGAKEPTCHLLDSPLAEIAGPKGCPWVVPNARESGYYRYRLDKASFDRLLAHAAELDASERAGLVLNAWALMLLEKGSLADVGSVIAKIDLTKEPRVVVQAVTSVLEEMARVLVDESNEAAFAKYVGARLSPLAKKLGAATKAVDSDEVRLTRAALLATLVDFGPAGAAPDFEPVAKAYLADPKKGDPDVGPLALRVVARKGSPSAALVDAKRLANAVLPDERVALTVALASRQKPDALKETMGLLGNGTIRAGDYRHVRNAMMRRRDARKVFHQAMRDQFDALVSRLGGAAGFTGTLREICDSGELAELTAFFEPRMAKLEGSQRGFDEGVAEAKRCIATKERERKNSTVLFGK